MQNGTGTAPGVGYAAVKEGRARARTYWLMLLWIRMLVVIAVVVFLLGEVVQGPSITMSFYDNLRGDQQNRCRSESRRSGVRRSHSRVKDKWSFTASSGLSTLE